VCRFRPEGLVGLADAAVWAALEDEGSPLCNRDGCCTLPALPALLKIEPVVFSRAMALRG